MSERCHFIEHGGKQVVLLDCRGITTTDAAMEVIADGRALIDTLPKDGSGYTLTDVRGSRYNGEIMSALKTFAAANRPYIGRGAVVTDSGLHRVAILAVATFSGRVMRGFATREEALDWLVQAQSSRAA